MKTIKYILFITLIAFFAGGCKKALDEKVYDFYSPQNLYKTQADAESAVTGLYGYLHSWDFFKAPYFFGEDIDHDHIVGPLWNMGDMGAGNFNNYWGVAALYHGYYYIIAQANTILEKVPAIQMQNDSAKNKVLGQAYFFRGWAYANLVRLWGPVPLRLQNVSSGAPISVARSPVADVYAQAVKDLITAESLLPSKHSPLVGGVGSVTSGTAKAFLAKTYLTMASASLSGASLDVRGGPDDAYYTYTKDVVKGYEGMDSKSLFTKARDKALEVINSGDYQLQPTYMGIWSRANKNNKEMIWEGQTQDNDSYGTLLQYYYSAPWYGGTSYYWMASNLYDSYEDSDQRSSDAVFHQYYMYGAWMLYPERDSLKYKAVPGGGTAKFYSSYSHPFPKKYWIGTSTEVGESGTTVRAGNRDVDPALLRLADIILVYAEAENEVSGPTALAYSALDKVRKRSNESNTPLGLTQQRFRSLVFEERGKELAFENNRRFDLIRWGVYLQVMNKLGTVENVIKTRSQKNLLFPLPQAELNANKLITANNPGW